eukprot:TRINITY_DN1395_c0_g1_i4.p1 TRINITY_DN1395_c0_g1~~TRINITY_DN1395_c0_g1_i4.p1  ORF type:complete len:353 (-),score=56.01 TRINITY_DN1395_c0_g1_i4:14-1072(-)
MCFCGKQRTLARLHTHNNYNRKIRSAKRVLVGGPNIPDPQTKKPSRPTPNQLAHQLRRSARLLAMATVEAVLVLESGAASEQGLRPTMEDAHVAVDNAEDASSVTGSCTAFYGVYDGHGGTEASIMAGDHLHKNLFSDSKIGTGSRVEEALRAAFMNTDKILLESSEQNGWKNGTTAVVTLIIGSLLYLANAGDSECVLVKRKKEGGYKAVLLSEKHKPNEKNEKERIRNAGGHVVFGRLFGDLAVSRSLGDPDYKKPLSEADFVSADPFIQKVELTPAEDDFVILACDGLWDVVSYQEAGEIVGASRDEGVDANACASLLVNTALEKGSKDNITVIVVYFHWNAKGTNTAS